jgi:F0F1-type ATP synthase membrane subunit b/b'
MNNPEELTPFEEAFPEARGIHDKLADVREKILSREMSEEEAKAILKEVEKIHSEIRQKISLMRKAAKH